MTDRPIIFSAPMVRALLEGRKTQTRRVLKPFAYDPNSRCWMDGAKPVPMDLWQVGGGGPFFRVSYAPGDRLYVREAMHWTDNLRFVADDSVVDFDRMPEGFTAGRAHVSGMFMPRWASRLTLTVTEVRVQRLQDISNEDANAEGVFGECAFHVGNDDTYRAPFRDLWNSLHGPAAWDVNPWVVALTFNVQRRNIDEIGGSDA